MEKTILVPIDFSEQCMIAREQSYNLAKISHASITLLNVIKTGSSFWGIFSDKEKKGFELKIEKKLNATAREIEERTGVEAGIIMRKGKVTEEVIRVANYLSPMLIIMGTSSGISISRKIVGSRTLHIIKSSKFPIISVKGKINSLNCENILLPIDATKHTTQKVDIAIEMAKLFNSKITILTALDKNSKDKLKMSYTRLDEIKQRVETENIICETGLLKTDNGKDLMAMSILSYAHKVNADLIAIMTQQENGFSEFFLGSLAKNIIFSSDIPVLTINPK